MTEKFMDTETDRTKSKWVAKAFREFHRPRTTIRALYYYAMTREDEDYPICGGFVGEIRIVRRYHENDGEKLPKWVGRARLLQFIPQDAILDEIPGEHVIPPLKSPSKEISSEAQLNRTHNIELWLNKSALVPLILPVCVKHCVTLVSIGNHPSRDALEKLFARANQHPTILLCLSDLSIKGIDFCRDLAREIAELSSSTSMPAMGEKPDIKLRRTGLTPEQVAGLKISMAPGEKADMREKAAFARYKRYLKPYELDRKRQAELDALEVYYPGGISKFVDDLLSRYDGSQCKGPRLLDLKEGLIPGEEDIDFSGK